MDELDYKGKLYTKEFEDWIKQFVNNKKNVYPKIVELDPTSFCMFDCPECINSSLIKKEHSRMQFTYEELYKLINELKMLGIVGIIFIGGGEPLMHPKFADILKLCKKLNIKVGITTNGLLINKHMKAIAEIADWVRVSMDAANEVTFQRIRPNRIPNSFKIICDNIKKLSKIKKGTLGYSFLLVEDLETGYSNLSDLYEAAKLAKKLNCDYFEYKPMVDSNHFLFNYSKNFLNELYIIEKKLNELEDENFRILKPSSLYQYGQESLLQIKNYGYCPVTFLRTLITPYGIYPCPYKRGYEKFNLGNVREKSFKKIWDTYKLSNNSKEINPCLECKFYCIRHNINNELIKLSENIDLIEHIKFDETKDVFV